ncbi:hypothetical protein CEXT_494061 [Caerostris extrusa]|uniref:Uncharacterized protein n=1 Tax=Caerostris extrusa TaxID=172846 RepID=A0AAV4VXS2_CAEEX|nr:hypothetical protein CEXT_494061 [Caerostris extrusa]
MAFCYAGETGISVSPVKGEGGSHNPGGRCPGPNQSRLRPSQGVRGKPDSRGMITQLFLLPLFQRMIGLITGERGSHGPCTPYSSFVPFSESYLLQHT